MKHPKLWIALAALILAAIACSRFADKPVADSPPPTPTVAQPTATEVAPTPIPTPEASILWATESDYTAIYHRCADEVTEPFWEYPETPLDCQRVVATWGWVASADIGDVTYNVYAEDGSGFPDIESGVEVTLIVSPWAIEDSIFYGTEWDTGYEPPTKGIEVTAVLPHTQ
jgi:hypothetical protein